MKNLISKINNAFYLLKYSDDAYENLHKQQLQESEQITEGTWLEKQQKNNQNNKFTSAKYPNIYFYLNMGQSRENIRMSFQQREREYLDKDLGC